MCHGGRLLWSASFEMAGGSALCETAFWSALFDIRGVHHGGQLLWSAPCETAGGSALFGMVCRSRASCGTMFWSALFETAVRSVSLGMAFWSSALFGMALLECVVWDGCIEGTAWSASLIKGLEECVVWGGFVGVRRLR